MLWRIGIKQDIRCAKQKGHCEAMTEMHASNSELWTGYWQSGRIDTGMGAPTDNGKDGFSAFWQMLVGELPDDARIIDLGTGNGAVPRHLNRAAKCLGKTISIIGIDAASIDPTRTLGMDADGLAGVTFIGDTDLTKTGFGDGSFQGATSQFAIEHAEAGKAVPELLRILDSGAPFQLLLLHASSPLVLSFVRQIGEIDTLMADDGLVPAMRHVLEEPSTRATDALEKAGRMHMERYGENLSPIAEEVFAAVAILINSADVPLPVRRQAASRMDMRLKDEQARLHQLACAAMDENAAHDLRDLFQTAGAAGLALERMYDEDERTVLGWALTGQCAP